MKRLYRCSSTLAMALLLILALVCQQPRIAKADTRYTITDLGLFYTKWFITPYAINDAGQIVGAVTTKSGYKHAYFYNGSQLIDLGTLGGATSTAFRINNAGQILGTADLPNHSSHTFLYDHGQMTDLDILGGKISWVQGLTENGQIIGDSIVLGGTQAFLYSAGKMIYLGTLGGRNSHAAAINNAGQVVGSAELAGKNLNSHAFLYDHGQMTDLGTLGGKSSKAQWINNKGQVVGTADTSNNEHHIFLYQNSTMTDISILINKMLTDTTNSKLENRTDVFAIDDTGRVIGTVLRIEDKSAHENLFIYKDGRVEIFSQFDLFGGPSAINASGHFIGQMIENNASHPFLYRDGTLLDLGTLGGQLSYAYALNNNDNVVGTSMNPAGGTHAYIYRNATLNDLGPTYRPYSQASSINDIGQIAGYATTTDGVSAFLYKDGKMVDLGTTIPVEIRQIPNFQGTLSQTRVALALNNKGYVVGQVFSLVAATTDYVQHAFLYQNGQMADLDLNPIITRTLFSSASGINNADQVVGSYLDAPGTARSFLYQNGHISALKLPQPGEAFAINNSGQIAGYLATGEEERHAFLYQNDQTTDLGTLGGTNSQANALNDAGQVVGVAETTGGDLHAFLYQLGKMVDLGTLGGKTSEAHAINVHGLVVGTAKIATGDNHAFLYQNGRMIDLNTMLPAQSGWELEVANGINSNGQIVGSGIFNGERHAFLLAPPAASVPSSMPNTGQGGGGDDQDRRKLD